MATGSPQHDRERAPTPAQASQPAAALSPLRQQVRRSWEQEHALRRSAVEEVVRQPRSHRPHDAAERVLGSWVKTTRDAVRNRER